MTTELRGAGEPRFVLIDGRKYEKHGTSSTGATTCSTANRCPRAAFFDLQERAERVEGLSEHYPFARGSMAHTLALHLAIHWFKPPWWNQWVDAQTAILALLRTGTPKVQATLKKNFIPLMAQISHQIIKIFGDLFEACEVYAAESVLPLPVGEDLVYTPLVDLILYDPILKVYHFIDWKTTSMANADLKGVEEWDAKAQCVRVIRPGVEFFYSAEAQFQWMFLVGDHHFPNATVKVWAGVIRLIKGRDPEVEMVPIQRGGPEWRTALEKAIDPDGEPTPGQGACYTPYGPCGHWSKCYPEVQKPAAVAPPPVETTATEPLEY